jgi:hypothetical protein
LCHRHRLLPIDFNQGFLWGRSNHVRRQKSCAHYEPTLYRRHIVRFKRPLKSHLYCFRSALPPSTLLYTRPVSTFATHNSIISHPLAFPIPAFYSILPVFFVPPFVDSSSKAFPLPIFYVCIRERWKIRYCYGYWSFKHYSANRFTPVRR